MRPQIHIPGRAPIWRPGWDEETYERSRIVVPPEYRRKPQQATYAVISHTAAQSADLNSVTTSPISTLGADLIVIGLCTNAASPTPTDSQSNGWTGLTDRTISGVHTRLWYVQAPSTNGSHTFSATGSVAVPGIAVIAFSGSTATPFDQENGATSASTNNLSTGNITPTQDNELIVSILGDTFTTSASVSGGSLAITDQLVFSAGVAFGIAMAYEVQSAATTRSATWSWTSANRTEAAIASFKAAAGGATRPVKMAGAWGGYAGESGGFAG